MACGVDMADKIHTSGGVGVPVLVRTACGQMLHLWFQLAACTCTRTRVSDYQTLAAQQTLHNASYIEYRESGGYFTPLQVQISRAGQAWVMQLVWLHSCHKHNVGYVGVVREYLVSLASLNLRTDNKLDFLCTTLILTQALPSSIEYHIAYSVQQIVL